VEQVAVQPMPATVLAHDRAAALDRGGRAVIAARRPRAACVLSIGARFYVAQPSFALARLQSIHGGEDAVDRASFQFICGFLPADGARSPTSPAQTANEQGAYVPMSSMESPRDPSARTHDANRRTAAIVFADAVGYTRLMQVDELDTHTRMMRLQAEVIEPGLRGHHGQLVKTTGDGFLATFDDPGQAIACAVELQRALLAAGAAESPSSRISFRMAVNMADIIVEQTDIYGDGVNIAARLQTYAEPGGIVVAAAAAEKAGAPAGLEFADLGHLPLRGFKQPVRAFGLRVSTGTRPLLGEAVPGSEGPPSIVVLPFREQNIAPSEVYFAEGIVDDVIHALSGLKELFVIARGSTLGYRERQFDVRAIGRDLGVRYVMHGSIQRTETAIRIRTELCNAETGEVVYSDQHDGEMNDLFSLQRRIAHRIVMILAPQVRERERLRAMRKDPHNMTAYDLLLQALGPLFGMDYPSFSLAHGLLKRAIAHDPHYGPPYSYQAYWHLLRVGQGWSNDPAADTEEASRMAQTALELDDNDALALAIYGHVHSYLKRDLETAVELQERAIEMGPSCAMAWTLSSVTRGFLGHGAIAVARAERGLQLSPRGPHVVYHEHILSQAHYVNGDYAQAVHWGRMAARHNERLTSNLRCLVASLMACGREDEAKATARRLMEIDPAMTLAEFARRTPLPPALRDPFVERLRSAGIPD
jgi:adenylate cyclase